MTRPVFVTGMVDSPPVLNKGALRATGVSTEKIPNRSWPGSENDITSDENSDLFDRPVTESATAGAGIKTDSFSVEHAKCCEIPVTELITVRVSDTEEPLIMRVSTITTELPEIGKECVIPEHRRPVKLSADADTQVVISDYQQSVQDYCFGVCEKTDSIDRSGIGWCWDCLG